MRRLFIVLAKIFGLLQLYRVLVEFMEIGFSFGFMSRAVSYGEAGPNIWGMLGTLAYLLLSVVLARLLILRTEWLADKLGIRDEPVLDELKDAPILLIGVKLIGVYVLVYAIPSFTKTILDYGISGRSLLWLHFFPKVIPAILQLALGVLLTVRTDMILAVITKSEQAENRHLALTCLAFLLVMILFGLTFTSFISGYYGEGGDGHSPIYREHIPANAQPQISARRTDSPIRFTTNWAPESAWPQPTNPPTTSATSAPPNM